MRPWALAFTFTSHSTLKIYNPPWSSLCCQTYNLAMFDLAANCSVVPDEVQTDAGVAGAGVRYPSSLHSMNPKG
jgi:hypothetical protein